MVCQSAFMLSSTEGYPSIEAASIETNGG